MEAHGKLSFWHRIYVFSGFAFLFHEKNIASVMPGESPFKSRRIGTARSTDKDCRTMLIQRCPCLETFPSLEVCSFLLGVNLSLPCKPAKRVFSVSSASSNLLLGLGWANQDTFSVVGNATRHIHKIFRAILLSSFPSTHGFGQLRRPEWRGVHQNGVQSTGVDKQRSSAWWDAIACSLSCTFCLFLSIGHSSGNQMIDFAGQSTQEVRYVATEIWLCPFAGDGRSQLLDRNFILFPQRYWTRCPSLRRQPTVCVCFGRFVPCLPFCWVGFPSLPRLESLPSSKLSLS